MLNKSLLSNSILDGSFLIVSPIMKFIRYLHVDMCLVLEHNYNITNWNLYDRTQHGTPVELNCGLSHCLSNVELQFIPTFENR